MTAMIVMDVQMIVRLMPMRIMAMHGRRCAVMMVMRVSVRGMIVHGVIVPDVAVMHRLGVRGMRMRVPMGMGVGRLVRGVRLIVRDRGGGGIVLRLVPPASRARRA